MLKNIRSENRFHIKSVIVAALLIFLVSGVASATVNTYYWEPSTGSIGSSGFTANWGSCGAQPTSYSITTLDSAGFNCQSDMVTTSGTGNMVLAIYPTKYNTATQVTGRPGATFYLRERSGHGSVTFRFELGYAKAGAFTSFGYVSQTVPSGYANSYTINMSNITGTAPVDSYLALRISTTLSSGEQRINLGTNGGTTGSNSGRFSVDEVADQSNPTYNVTVRPSPLSAGIIAGGNYIYTITVNNTGNTNGNYTLGVTDSDTTNFLNSALGRTTLSVPAGSSNQTTLTITARENASNGAVDTITVTATSVENPSYTNSTQVTTTVQATGQSANPQIKLTTNRYIILDDPNSGYSGVTANAGTGFGKPGSWNTDAWNGESTTVRGVALVLDANGLPASGVTVTFSVQDWADPVPRALKSDTNNKTNVTNTDGLATASFNLNNEQQYGRWKVTATATVNGTPVSSSSNFVYNWWGCQNCHGSPYSSSGDDKSYTGKISPSSTRYDPYSPYVTGRDFHNQMYTDHHLPTGGDLVEGECWACHNSYDRDLNLGQERHDNGLSYSGKGVPSTYGAHANETCADCHSIIGNSQTGSQTVKSCDATGCHQGTTDFNSHVGQEGVVATSPNKYVNYSGQDVNSGLRSYSGINPTAATFNSSPLIGARAHTSATVQNIPCTVCHGPMHNITKPDPNTVPKNTVTEDTQCTTCHQSLKHSNSNPVYCTACHSQDAHTINILNKTAASQPSYVFIGSVNAINSSATDCEQCHAPGAEANFFGSLTTYDSAAYSKNFMPATPVHNRHNGTVNCNVCHDNSNFHNITYLTTSGTYSTSNVSAVTCIDCHSGQNTTARNTVNSKLGRFPPVVNTPVNHSTDRAGVKWGTYWTSTNEACLYCHGDNKHNATRLGRPLQWLGSSYQLYGAIGTKSTCADCHYKGANNYSTMQSVFTSSGLPIPPEITNGSWNGLAGYFNHSLTSYLDQDCKGCHGSLLSSGANMSEFLHNVAQGGGGPNCIGCHDIGGTAQHIINNTAMDTGVHVNINKNATNGTGISSENKKCWACHQSDGQQPTGMGDRYSSPYKCYDCHNGTAPYSNVSSAPVVSEHFRSGLDIKAQGSAPDNSTSCIACHNTSEMKVIYTGDNAGTNFSLPSHYGMKRTDLMGLTQTAYCLYCHDSSVENVTFGVSDFNNSIVNHSGGITTPQCADCHDTIKENLARLHNDTMTKPVSNDTLCKNCHGPGGNASTNNKVEHKNLYCTECHANGTVGTLAGKGIHGIKYLTQNNTFSVANTSAVNCVTCHQTSIVDSSLGVFTPPKISSSGALHHSDNVLNGTVWGNYWTPGTNTACIYCHSDTKHNATPLGRPLQWLGSSYQLYGAIGTNSTCAGCHYKGDANYGAMNSAFTNAGLNIPPEITNGSWNGKPGYINHNLSEYIDINCRSCHGAENTVGQLIHNVSNPHTSSKTEQDCRNCHGTDTSGIHHNLVNEGKYGCIDCHPSPINSQQFVERNCLVCHHF